MVRRDRVLHIPADVGGHAIGLSRAEQKLGFQSHAVLFQTGPFGYVADGNLHLETANAVSAFFRRFFYFFRVVTQYDIFHFYFGESIVPFNLDLPLLKLLRKKMFFTFQGCDIRLHTSHGVWKGQSFTIQHDCVCNQTSDVRKRIRVWFIHLFATKSFILNPDLFLSSPTSEYLPYAHLDVHAIVPKHFNSMDHESLVIVHAPSNRALKGTRFIEQSVANLRHRDQNIELVILEHRKQSEIINLCRNADVAIDQLLIGWYGAFAVEMMALGIPVICFLDQRFAHVVPSYHAIPIINADAGSLEDILGNMLHDRSSLRTVGAECRKYVLATHDPLRIAHRMILEYQHAD